MLFSIFDVLRIFEALQILFYKFLLKWKIEEDFESSIFLESQKYYFAFESRLICFFFFEMVIFATLFRRCQKLGKSTFRRCLMLFNSTWKYTLFQRCWMLYISTLTYATLFQRWFDVVRRRVTSLRYWVICVLQLFVNQTVTSYILKLTSSF